MRTGGFPGNRFHPGITVVIGPGPENQRIAVALILKTVHRKTTRAGGYGRVQALGSNRRWHRYRTTVHNIITTGGRHIVTIDNNVVSVARIHGGLGDV